MTERTCVTCHYFNATNKEAIGKCFGGDAFCTDNPDRPNWKHMTRSDALRTMSDADLARFLAACVKGTPGQWLTWLKEDYEI